MREVKIGAKYRHFKGMEVEVLMIAKDSEDLSDLVIYQGMYKDNPIFSRKIDEFFSEMNKEKYPNSKIIQNTIGYSEFFEFSEINLAVDKIKQYTRNFAKRQLTYFRSNPEIRLIKNEDDILQVLKKGSKCE